MDMAAVDALSGDLLEAEVSGAAAAVLVAITDRPRPGVILTVRREHLRTHAGQVAFPGGRIDPGEDAVAAALREAQEEIALDPAQVAVIGTGDLYCTVTNYVVTPVVGIIPPGLPLEPHEHEVADWFEAPLDFLLDPRNERTFEAEFGGRRRRIVEMQYGSWRIWGATAAMLVNFRHRLEAAA